MDFYRVDDCVSLACHWSLAARFGAVGIMKAPHSEYREVFPTYAKADSSSSVITMQV